MLTKIRKALFSRATVMVLAVALEAVLIAVLVHWLNDAAGWIAGGLRFLSLFILLFIAKNSRHLNFDLMWIFLIFLFPVFGTAAWLILGANLITSREGWRIIRATESAKDSYRQDPEVLEQAIQEFPAQAGGFRYLSEHAGFPVYKNREGDFDYYPLGDQGFPVMLEELKKAEKFIFLEYFIISKGEMWDAIHEILKAKAEAGLDVRVLYDDMGSFTTLPLAYAKHLEREGIRCLPFNRVSPILGAIMNHRDHRKILVIDGRTAFSGGINLADEYINRQVRFGHWKDNVIRVRGAAVWSFTVMFLTHWRALSQEDEDFEKFRVSILETNGSPISDGYIIPYGDTPLDEEHVGQDVYMNILNSARRYCWIMTPYLILDNEFVNALTLAAARGVDVRIVTPGIPDKKMVWGVTRSFYQSLIRGGVRVYEYSPGFVHAKVFVCDDQICTVGTINLDYRSLYLHFENGTCVVGSSQVTAVRDDVAETIDRSEEISPEMAKFGLFFNLKYAFLRIFAGQL